ncbi:MAG: hypothetical protein U1E98_02315 [Moraxella osloensis]
MSISNQEQQRLLIHDPIWQLPPSSRQKAMPVMWRLIPLLR